MNPFETVIARCGEIGLDATVASAGGTISAKRAALDATVRASTPATTTSRELPKISVDLGRPATTADTHDDPREKVERDLEVISMLGEGGMGRVHLARQHSLDREVAIKTLHDSASEKDRAALISEGAITGHLEHPTIIPVHALGVDADGSPVLVMKRVEGVAWTELLADPKHEAWGTDGRDRLAGHLDIFMQVCNAAHFAHSRSIVHRDIKPHNVLIGRYGDVYLGDWGLAIRVDGEWTAQPICGTPAYMAPEMVVGGSVDARTDVYLLGATLHQILTGKPRNAGKNMREALYDAIAGAPVEYPASVPKELGAIANRATSREPETRYATAAELRQAIADHLQHKTSVALAESAAERIEKLRPLLGGHAKLGDETTQRSIDLLGVEARFALDEALRQWPNNPIASRASRDLDELLASRHARAAELERLARDVDPRVSQRQRAIAFAAIALVGASLSVHAIASGARDVTTRDLFFESLVPVAAYSIAIALMRRHTLSTTFNRKMTMSGFVAFGGVAVLRALGLLAGVGPSQELMLDSVVLAALAVAFGVTLVRWVAWSGLLMLASAAVAAAFPARALLAFSLATGVALVMNAFIAWRSSVAREDG